MFTEFLVAACLAVIALLMLGRERRHPGITDPFLLGMCQALAVVVVLFLAWAAFWFALGSGGGGTSG